MHEKFHYKSIQEVKDRAADDSCIVTDNYLKSLEEKFGEAAWLAKEAGFDAVDIKCCHGYLLAELSSAYTRPGQYGRDTVKVLPFAFLLETEMLPPCSSTIRFASARPSPFPWEEREESP